MIYLFQKFSASEEFFGVFISLLGITVFAKSEKLGEKSLGNSPTTVEFLNFFFIYTQHTILLLLQMWQVMHRTRAPKWFALVASRYDMTISVFFNRVQLLSDDPHKAVINTVQYTFFFL